ncbi:MAG: hypothetical protein RLZZ303_2488 [Candidatus Hydrogenedentota bacterium]|jgi:poly(A) polymerase
MDAREAAARGICTRLTAAGHVAYLAGGCVRDLLLGVRPGDYDIATDASPEQVAALFERTAGVGAAFGVMLVLLPEGPFEVATFRWDGPYLDGRRPSEVRYATPEEDARRRDFTINAMFLDPATDTVLDFVGGKADIAARTLRAVGDPLRRFEEDHLRLLRAVRFAARLGYAIDSETWQAMVKLASRIRRTSAERVRDELSKMLTHPSVATALDLLDHSGLLVEVLPEVTAMKGVRQPPEFHPEGDVFVHTKLVMAALNRPSPALALGALLHDCGKPATFTETDRIRFHGHDEVGAQFAQAVCERLRLSTRDTEHVVWLVREHMHLAHVPGMRESKRKRFVRQKGFDDLLELCRADCVGSLGDLTLIRQVLDYLEALPPDAVKPHRILTGKDLIEAGYTPGPQFQSMLRDVEDAQLEGLLDSRDAALAWLANRNS